MSALPLLSELELTRCCCPDPEGGFGALRTDQGNLPLRQMDVRAHISGLIARTELRQTYVNTLRVPVEATYIFPLPDRAAVSAFRFEVGERVIDGVLKERGEARQTYDRAIASGHRAAIAEEERPGVFTMRVGNLMPGEEASVHLTLNGPLPYSDGEATYRFPLVVAPRYIPGSALSGESVGEGTAVDTDAVPDASRISPPVLLPGFPNPVRLNIQVDLDAGGLPLGDVRSSLHTISEAGDGTHRHIRIVAGERLNRDFVLRFGLGSNAIGSSLVVVPDSDGEGEGTFQLTLVPPLGVAQSVKPRDVVFVLDRSGSMSGWKMIAARRACARMLDTLTDADRFSVLAFDNSVETPRHAGQLVDATNRNRFRAVEFLAKLEARGGTEMAQPLKRAVDDLLAEEPAGRERILILITDGQVGNEDQILRNLGGRLAGVRVFTLGIDRAVNAAFLRRLAGLGGGSCELVESEDRLDTVMDKVHRRIGTPLLTDLHLEGGLQIVPESVVPRRLPDLFAGSPVRISGRYAGAATASAGIKINAMDSLGRPYGETVAATASKNRALTAVWARGQVRELEDRFQTLAGSARSHLAKTITATSLRFSVLCRFTSFVAVDRAEVVNQGGQVHRVTQAVEQPDGSPKKKSKPASGAWGLAPRSARSAPPAGFVDPFGAPGSAAPFSAPSSADPFAPPTGGFGGSNDSSFGGDPFGGASPSSDPFAGSFGADPFSAPAPKGGPSIGSFDAFAPPRAGSDAPQSIVSGSGFMGSSPPPPSDGFGSPPLEFKDALEDDGWYDMGTGAIPPIGDMLELDLEEPEPMFGQAPPRSQAPGRGTAKNSESVFGRLLGALGMNDGLRDRRRPSNDDELAAYRRRGEELLRGLALVDATAHVRVRELGRLLMLLEALIEDLRSVGLEGEAVRLLATLIAELGVVRRRSDLKAQELTRLLDRSREALEAFVSGAQASSGSSPGAGRGESFWF